MEMDFMDAIGAAALNSVYILAVKGCVIMNQILVHLVCLRGSRNKFLTKLLLSPTATHQSNHKSLQ